LDVTYLNQDVAKVDNHELESPITARENRSAELSSADSKRSIKYSISE